MFNTATEYREFLKGCHFEELLDQELLVCWAQEEIYARLECYRSELECLGFEELLGANLIKELVEDEINDRVEKFAKDMQRAAKSSEIKTEDANTGIVREIIMEEIKLKNRVSKYYVLERIKVMIHHTDLHTKAVERKLDCDDGIKNMSVGAKLVFSDSWRQLKKEFQMDADNWISLRV